MYCLVITDVYWEATSFRHQRDFIGIEIDPVYFALAEVNMKQEEVQPPLNLYQLPDVKQYTLT
jgi:hypothetical protein